MYDCRDCVAAKAWDNQLACVWVISRCTNLAIISSIYFLQQGCAAFLILHEQGSIHMINCTERKRSVYCRIQLLLCF